MTAIHCEVYGQGQSLVLLHGWAMHSGIWREFAQQLAGRYQVICLDLPGHGRSQPLERFDLASVSAALLAAIPVEQFSVLGWSLGAELAINLAASVPKRVNQLLLLAGNPKFVGDDGWPGVQPKVLQAFASQLNGDIKLMLTRFLALQVNGLPDAKRHLTILKTALQACDAPWLPNLQAGLAILESTDLRQQLARLQCPITVIQGDKDPLIPVATADAIQQLNPQITTHILPNAGHVPFISHNQQLLDIIGVVL